MKPCYSKIVGTGSYLPHQSLTNNDLEQMVDTNNQWIVERTGIHTRHIAAAGESTCDMAHQASLRALTTSGLLATDIDLIIVATSTPDAIMPSTACYLQNRLGIKVTKGAFDLQAACSGFVYALSVADAMIKANLAQHALVVGVDLLSKIVDYNDRGTCILFGDGAGAVVLSASDEPGIIASQLYSDGSYASILGCNATIAAGQITGYPYLTMDGAAVFKFAVKSLSTLSRELVEKTGHVIDDIDWMIPHQANMRILEAVAHALKLPLTKVIATVQYHGNTSAASVPLALDDAINNQKIKPGHLVLLNGIGAGFTWGGVLIRY